MFAEEECGAYSAAHCELCGFATVTSPLLRSLLCLSPLTPLSLSVTLSLQWAISQSLYRKRISELCQRRMSEYHRDEQASPAHAGGCLTESDAEINENGTPESAHFSDKRQMKAEDEVRLLEARLMNIKTMSCSPNYLAENFLAVAAFPHGANDFDRAAFGWVHLEQLKSLLLKLQNSANDRGLLWPNELIESLLQRAEAFILDETEIEAVLSSMRDSWRMLQRLRPC